MNNITINLNNIDLASSLMEAITQWSYDPVTGSLTGWDVDSDNQAVLKNAIEVSTLFGRTAYSVEDGTQILSYRTKQSALNKLACICTKQFLKQMSSPYSEDYRISKELWKVLVEDMLAIFETDPAVQQFKKQK